MNILLDAFFDLNYGDDLFIETMTGLFPQCKFYSFLEHYPASVIEWAKKLPNLYLLPESDVFLQKNMFDGYICVGGDIFPDKGDYTKRKKYVQAVQQVGGAVVFWGFSLFHDYSAQTEADLVELMNAAHVIAPRDERSAAYLRRILPGREITAVADLAFLSAWKSAEPAENKRLGISVRRPNYATEEDMLRYCANLQKAIDAYLKEDGERQAVLLSLSAGNTSDGEVAEEIISGVAEKNRVSHVVYTGDTAAIKEELAKCELVICTRLHAMISCIAMGIPFIPIVYEVKMEHILDEIGYRAHAVHFADMDGIALQVNCAWDGEKTSRYIHKTDAALERLRRLVCGEQKALSISKADSTGPVLEEKEQLARTYETALKQLSTDVATLENALNQRATDVATLESALNQRAADVATLEKALDEQNATIGAQSTELAQRQESIRALEARLREIEATFLYRAAMKVLRMVNAVKSVFAGRKK